MTSSTSGPAAEPQRFGEYLLAERIAQGGMAELFLAKRRGVEGFEKIVAIKRILPELSWNRDFVSMFINEAKIAARLSHPNIVQIFDFGKVDDYYFIAMEYVHGENLRTILRRGEERQMAMPQEVAAFVMARASAGLDHAHRKTDGTGKALHIIHRDVSPQNVLVSYEGEVKVVDFGIAKAVAENPEATRGVLKGKLAYLSPEQVTGGNLDARSDVFAAGVVLYELLAGGKLFDQKSSPEVLDAIVRIDSSAVANQVPGLHKRLREVLRRSLAANPAERYRSAGEMQQALDAYLRERGDSMGSQQIAGYMRLLFDEKIGASTLERLRSEVLGGGTVADRAWQGVISLSPRWIAAIAGGVLGLVALAIAAPMLRHRPVAPPLPASPTPETPGRPEAEARRPPEPEPAAAPELPTGPKAVERAGELLASGKAGDAVAEFERAFAVDPGLRKAHARDYARALTEDGRRRLDEGAQGAAERFTAAIEADPDLFDARFYLAKLYTRRSDSEGAQREYREAVRINPRSADAHFNLGFIYFTLKRYDEALKEYEKVLALEPPYLADVYYNAAACYEGLKRKADAVTTLRRGLEAVPDSDLLRQRLKQLGG